MYLQFCDWLFYLCFTTEDDCYKYSCLAIYDCFCSDLAVEVYALCISASPHSAAIFVTALLILTNLSS